jgi:hypothetical protein
LTLNGGASLVTSSDRPGGRGGTSFNLSPPRLLASPPPFRAARRVQPVWGDCSRLGCSLGGQIQTRPERKGGQSCRSEKEKRAALRTGPLFVRLLQVLPSRYIPSNSLAGQWKRPKKVRPSGKEGPQRWGTFEATLPNPPRSAKRLHAPLHLPGWSRCHRLTPPNLRTPAAPLLFHCPYLTVFPKLKPQASRLSHEAKS